MINNEKKINPATLFFIGIIIIIIFPFLIPFLIFGIIFFIIYSKNNKNINLKYFEKYKEKYPELYKRIAEVLEQKGNNYNKQKLETAQFIKKSKSSYYDTMQENTKEISKPIEKVNHLHDNKSDKKYQYNGGKSIWDDYDSIADKLRKK